MANHEPIDQPITDVMCGYQMVRLEPGTFWMCSREN